MNAYEEYRQSSQKFNPQIDVENPWFGDLSTPKEVFNFNGTDIPLSSIGLADDDDIPTTVDKPNVKKDTKIESFEYNFTPSLKTSVQIGRYNKFENAMTQAIKEIPDIANYKDFLTMTASMESSFKSDVKNPGGRMYGYFQFRSDDKVDNIGELTGMNPEQFMKNPVEQIKAAYMLAKQFESQYTQEDIAKAEAQGITRWGMLGGAWLGGVGGLRAALKGENRSDRHWNNGKGTDVLTRIKQNNFIPIQQK